ncbi:hypothetical protein ACP4OV_013065 [Aristida adscensionis]
MRDFVAAGPARAGGGAAVGPAGGGSKHSGTESPAAPSRESTGRRAASNRHWRRS